MPVLVLTSAAGVAAKAAEAVAARMAAAGMAPDAPRRLAAGAVEIWYEDGDPRGLAGAGLDANVVPEVGRRKRLLIADMDSTIIAVECIDELADFAGVRPQVEAITEAAMRGALDFEGALEARAALLAGLPESVLRECYEARVRLNPGARTLVRTMAALGAETALVSGGFEAFAAWVAAEAGFAGHRANRLETAEGRLTGRVPRPILGRAAKREALEKIAARAGLDPRDALAVGDGANDLDMIRAAGLGVAYRAKPALAEAADARIDHSDLTALLALQGIGEAEWRE